MNEDLVITDRSFDGPFARNADCCIFPSKASFSKVQRKRDAQPCSTLKPGEDAPFLSVVVLLVQLLNSRPAPAAPTPLHTTHCGSVMIQVSDSPRR